MPDLPPGAIQAAAEVLRDRYDKPVLDASEFTAFAERILSAAAPFMAEAVAAKIKAHGEKHFGHMRSARVRFDIAARIAAGAFDTKEDRIRMITEALEHGDAIVCDIPEVPARPREDEDRD